MAVSIAYPTVLIAGLDHRYSWTAEFPPSLIAAGFTLISSGYAFAAWAFAENRFFYSVVCVHTDRGHAVCDTGPYAVLRHPGYTGNILGLFGVVLALGSMWALIPAAVALVIAVTRTALEDKTLINELPGYSEYADRVRYRLIPGVY
jgi:protein-S-isoprenylcysteine O-methyltransferase Ste14